MESRRKKGGIGSPTWSRIVRIFAHLDWGAILSFVKAEVGRRLSMRRVGPNPTIMAEGQGPLEVITRLEVLGDGAYVLSQSVRLHRSGVKHVVESYVHLDPEAPETVESLKAVHRNKKAQLRDHAYGNVRQVERGRDE